MQTMKKVLIAALLFVTVTAISWGENQEPIPSQEQRYRNIAGQIKLFGEVYREVNRNYVDTINADSFIQAGIDGMLGTLDPYTVYFEPDAKDELEMLTNGSYGGIGVEIGLRGKDKELTIVSPIEGTPAARKGLRPGDVIIAVDGKSTKGFTTQDAAKAIRGPAGTIVTLTIRRLGFEEPLQYTLERADIIRKDVAFADMLDDSIAYIKLVRFSNHAGSELKEALQEALTHNPRGLVLDLRSNPGGMLYSAVEVAELFLPKGSLIVSTKVRVNSSNRDFSSQTEPIIGDIPMTVLVNRGSASASEIVTGAIQDYDRGAVIGSATFGKGLVQTVFQLSEGSAVKITTARYYTPSGRLIQRDLNRGDEYMQYDPETSELIGTVAESNQDSSLQKTEVFHTKSGRQVLGGGGIIPDVEIDPEYLLPAIVEMYRQDLFFTFIETWMAANGQPANTNAPAELLESFYDKLQEIDFKPPEKGHSELEKLRALGKKDSLNADFFRLVDELQVELNGHLDLRSPGIQKQIRAGLEREIASVLGGQEARIRVSLKDDLVLKTACEILQSPSRYQALLLPQSDGKTLGAR